MEEKMRKWSFAGIACLLLIVFGGGYWTGMWAYQKNTFAVPVARSNETEFQLIAEAWNITQDHYVDKTATTPRRLAYGSIGGMLDSLGDTGHSTFLTPDELRQQTNYEQGQLEGIGLEVQAKGGNVTVVAPIEGSPAQKAGIRPGDIILKVNGLPIGSVQDAVQRILGPAGTSVTITVQTPSGDSRDITLVRAKITIVSVTWRQLPGTSVVHLRLASFSQDASSELDKAFSTIKAVNPSGIVLDLRDNPGGLLDEAIRVSSRFLRSGNSLLVKDAQGAITPIPITSGATATDLPVAVLVNQGTASAAEIVAGALQDAGRARLVGEKTFGTGTVLNQFPLADGSALLVATEEWLTPSGKTIWHLGLTPDLSVSLPSTASPLFPASEQGLTPDQLKTNGDQQLLSALNLLTAK
jgi:carboxyl-terminal processing protease